MAKARMLSQEAAEDSKLGRCSLEAAYTYVLTIPFLDRDGLVSGKPNWIGGHALSERTELHTRVGSFIEEWVTQGLVTRYEGNNGPVLYFHGFRKHNSHLDYRREQESKFPPPPNYIRSDDGLLPLNPRVARIVADALDKRNAYRIALLIHADKLEGKEAAGLDAADEIILQALGKSGDKVDDLDLHKDSDENHRKVIGVSPESHRSLRGVSGESLRVIEDQDQVKDQENGREENTTTTARALITFARPLLLPEWNGGGVYLESLTVEQLRIVSSWLWLWKKLKRKDRYSPNEYADAYRPDPFTGIDNPVGFIRVKVKEGAVAPLQEKHRADFEAELRQLQEPQP